MMTGTAKNKMYELRRRGAGDEYVPWLAEYVDNIAEAVGELTTVTTEHCDCNGCRGQDHEIEGMLEYIEGLETELDARRECSKTLANVVAVAKEWNATGLESYTAIRKIYMFVEERINVPEITLEQTIDTILMTNEDRVDAAKEIAALIKRIDNDCMAE